MPDGPGAQPRRALPWTSRDRSAWALCAKTIFRDGSGMTRPKASASWSRPSTMAFSSGSPLA